MRDGVHRRIAAAATLLLAAGLLAGGCGGGASSESTPTTKSSSDTGGSRNTDDAGPGGQSGAAAGTKPGAIDGCLPIGGDVRKASFGSGGDRVSGALVGQGSTGVAFANQSDRDLCGWVPLARGLAGRGVISGLFDYSSVGSAEELGAVVERLRALGAKRLVVVGASVGGRAVVTLGAKPGSNLDQIVSLSGERSDSSNPPPDLLSDARRIRSTPVLYAGSKRDGYTVFGKDTRRLYRATPSTGSRLLLVSGRDHGVALLANGRVRRAVVAAILGR